LHHKENQIAKALKTIQVTYFQSLVLRLVWHFSIWAFIIWAFRPAFTLVWVWLWCLWKA